MSFSLKKTKLLNFKGFVLVDPEVLATLSSPFPESQFKTFFVAKFCTFQYGIFARQLLHEAA